MKRFSTPLWTFSLPIIVGLLVSWASWRLPLSLKKFEEAAFVFPERFQKHSYIPSYSRTMNWYVVIVDDVRPRETPKANLSSYVIDKETEDILGNADLTPANWTFLINSIREAGTTHLVIAKSPSWETADEVALRALGHELSLLESYAVGVDLRRGPNSEDFPEYLAGSVIPSHQGIDEEVPSVNQISPHPSIEAPIYGFSQLELVEPDEEKEIFKIPLLVRWEDKLLPSLELASLIARLGLTPADLIYVPGKCIYLREITIPIDKKGRAPVPFKKVKPLSTSKILVSPEDTPPLVSLISSETSLQQQQFPLTVQYLESFGQTSPGIRYHRLPFWKEAAFLVLFVLILHRRKWWLTALTALAYFAFPFLTNEWLLLSPPLAAALTFCALKIRSSGEVAREENSTSAEAKTEAEAEVKPKKKTGEKQPGLEEAPCESEEEPKKEPDVHELPKRHSSTKRQPTTSRDRLAKKKRSN